MSHHETFMRRALELAHNVALVDKSAGCFGAVVVKEGKIIGEGVNQVIKNHDPTCHGEIQAIRAACKNLKTHHLDGCILYTSGESCPMCLGAAYWAHIKEIYYASTIKDAEVYGNFQDLHMFEEFKKENGERQIKSIPLLREEALVVWKKFQAMPNRVHY